jgi:hypothetical protein
MIGQKLIELDVLRAARQAGRQFYERDHDPAERKDALTQIAEVHTCEGQEELIGQLADWLAEELRARNRDLSETISGQALLDVTKD